MKKHLYNKTNVLPIAHCSLFIGNWKLPIALCIVLIANCLLPTSSFAQNNRLWATYYGGTDYEIANFNSVATDAVGNVYIAGHTNGLSGIASGGFQNTHGGSADINTYGGDAFLVKFDPSGNRLWATYYGGTGYDYGYCVTTDAVGNVYLGGMTFSSSGIASGGFQNTYVGNNDPNPDFRNGGDAFLVKFDASGNRLWATYYGGDRDDYAYGLATNVAGDVYMAGYTRSPSGIASPSGFKTNYSDLTGAPGGDGFLVKFDASGNRLWATYYGGTNPSGNAIGYTDAYDEAYSVATDIFGNVYLTGYTGSTIGIASKGSFQDTINRVVPTTGKADAFLVKFDPNGVRLWATYYGDLSADYGNSVATDAIGNVYLAGSTWSEANIASGGFQNTHGSAGNIFDAFLVKFDPSGNRLWGTYYGGPNRDLGQGVATDATGNVYLAGITTSTINISSGGFQNTFSKGYYQDAFLVEFDHNGNRLCATYYTGWEDQYPSVPRYYSIATNAGNVYLAGSTAATANVASSGSFQNTLEGGTELFLVKFTTCGDTTLNASVASTTTNCKGACTGTAIATPINGTGPYSYSWNTIPIQTNDTATGLCEGTYTLTVTDAANSTAMVRVVIRPITIKITVGSTQTGCTGSTGTAEATPANGTPAYTYLWTDGQTTKLATALAAGTYTVIVTDSGGCTQTETVTVPSAPNWVTLTDTSTQTGCLINTGTATIIPANGTLPYTYVWSNGQTNSTATALGMGTYTVSVTDANGCTQTDTVTITQTIEVPTATANASAITIILGNSTTLNATGGGVYQWMPVTGLNCATCANPLASPAQTTHYCVTVADTNNCTDSACVIIYVEIPCGELFVPTAFSPNGDGANDVLYVKANCVQQLEFKIFDRWGNKVFESAKVTDGWDGTYNDKALNEGIYVYYLSATLITGEIITKKGSICLMR